MITPVTDHRFTVRRQDGIGPHPDDKPCAIPTCGLPKSAHVWPTCEGILTIKGASYGCDLTAPHGGWGHQNAEAEAVWA